ncbi:hypothetical protein V6N13_091652 [Hibiscus sabdariffa]
MQSQNVCGRPRVNSLRTDSDNVSLDDGNCHQVLGPKRMNKTLGFPSGLTFKNDFWAGGEADNLVDVQIQAASESNMSSGHSVSIEPVFNSATGLYSVKPKYAPHLKGNNLGIFESHFKVVQNRGSVSSPKIRVQSKQRSSREGSGGSIPKGRKDVFGAAFEDDAMVAEARATLEVCEFLWLFFDDNQHSIMKKLVELDKFEKRVAVRNLLASSKAKILLIQESKLQQVDSKFLGQLCGSRSNFNFLFSASRGSAGGLISVWDPNFFECESNWVAQNYIAMVGKFLHNDFKCVVINVYGPNDAKERLELFDELRRLTFGLNCPILMGGDFNVVRYGDEKIGMSLCKGAIYEFSSFINELTLLDLPLIGGRFTWSNFREVPAFSRLDRFLISPEFLGLWKDLAQFLLQKSISDHNPIGLAFMDFCWGPRPFKWFEHLLDDKTYIDKVNVECSNSCGKGIMPLLKVCKRISKDWVPKKVGVTKDNIRSLEAKCVDLESKIAVGRHVASDLFELKAARIKWPFSIASSAEFVQEPVSLRRLVYEEVYYERGSAASVGGRARFVL